MTTLEYLESQRKTNEARRARDGKQYTEIILLKQQNAVLRSTIEKLERDIESLKSSLDFYIDAAAERGAISR